MSLPKSAHFYVSGIRDLLWKIGGMTQEEIDRFANGCGPKEKLLGIDFVPDDLAGIDITPACNPHDVGYGVGKNDEDKTVADLMFLVLMVLEIIYSNASKAEKSVALNLAMKFYWGVHFHGKSAFYADK